MILVHHIFWYYPVFLKKDRTSSILIFSDRLVKLFTFKNHFLMRVKVLHSMRICLMMQGIWHVKHCGCCSCFTMKEWVTLYDQCAIGILWLVVFLIFLKAGLHSPKVSWIWKSLLWILLFQYSCHFVRRCLLILGLLTNWLFS